MQDINSIVEKLMMSETLERLGDIARIMRLDPSNTDDVSGVLLNLVLPLIFALDHDRIRFASDDEAAMLCALLTTALTIATNGSFANMTKPEQIH